MPSSFVAPLLQHILLTLSTKNISIKYSFLQCTSAFWDQLFKHLINKLNVMPIFKNDVPVYKQIKKFSQNFDFGTK